MPFRFTKNGNIRFLALPASFLASIPRMFFFFHSKGCRYSRTQGPESVTNSQKSSCLFRRHFFIDIASSPSTLPCRWTAVAQMVCPVRVPSTQSKDHLRGSLSPPLNAAFRKGDHHTCGRAGGRVDTIAPRIAHMEAIPAEKHDFREENRQTDGGNLFHC